jgi:hypothetical protein
VKRQIILGIGRLSPVAFIAMLVTLIALVLVLTMNAYGFRIRWSGGEIDMRPASFNSSP